MLSNDDVLIAIIGGTRDMWIKGAGKKKENKNT
jgi:hypothetical protein